MAIILLPVEVGVLQFVTVQGNTNLLLVDLLLVDHLQADHLLVVLLLADRHLEVLHLAGLLLAGLRLADLHPVDLERQNTFYIVPCRYTSRPNTEQTYKLFSSFKNL